MRPFSLSTLIRTHLSLSTLSKLHRSSICTGDFEDSKRFRSSIASTICTGERFRGSVISERFLFRSSIATTICTAISISLRSSDLNSDPSITRISSTSGGGTIAKPICSICYEDLNPIIEDLQSISIFRHVFRELWSVTSILTYYSYIFTFVHFNRLLFENDLQFDVFFDKPSLQQCIEYCSNAKKKRCPVCKQAFSEANVSRLYFQSVSNLYQKLINCEDNPGELRREIEKWKGRF
ncbi:hypothetical protein ACSBR2_028859 [Camellia fascicularis]